MRSNSLGDKRNTHDKETNLRPVDLPSCTSSFCCFKLTPFSNIPLLQRQAYPDIETFNIPHFTLHSTARPCVNISSAPAIHHQSATSQLLMWQASALNPSFIRNPHLHGAQKSHSVRHGQTRQEFATSSHLNPEQSFERCERHSHPQGCGFSWNFPCNTYSLQAE